MHKYTHIHGCQCRGMSVCEDITLLPNIPEAQMLINTCIFYLFLSPLSHNDTYKSDLNYLLSFQIDTLQCYGILILDYSVPQWW